MSSIGVIPRFAVNKCRVNVLGHVRPSLALVSPACQLGRPPESSTLAVRPCCWFVLHVRPPESSTLAALPWTISGITITQIYTLHVTASVLAR